MASYRSGAAAKSSAKVEPPGVGVQHRGASAMRRPVGPATGLAAHCRDYLADERNRFRSACGHVAEGEAVEARVEVAAEHVRAFRDRDRHYHRTSILGDARQ